MSDSCNETEFIESLRAELASVREELDVYKPLLLSLLIVLAAIAALLVGLALSGKRRTNLKRFLRRDQFREAENGAEGEQGLEKERNLSVVSNIIQQDITDLEIEHSIDKSDTSKQRTQKMSLPAKLTDRYRSIPEYPADPSTINSDITYIRSRSNNTNNSTNNNANTKSDKNTISSSDMRDNIAINNTISSNNSNGDNGNISNSIPSDNTNNSNKTRADGAATDGNDVDPMNDEVNAGQPADGEAGASICVPDIQVTRASFDAGSNTAL